MALEVTFDNEGRCNACGSTGFVAIYYDGARLGVCPCRGQRPLEHAPEGKRVLLKLANGDLVFGTLLKAVWYLEDERYALGDKVTPVSWSDPFEDPFKNPFLLAGKDAV